MKKIYSKLLMAVCSCAALAFSACGDSQDNDIQVVGPQSQGAYFPTNSPDDYDVTPEDSEITISIVRTNKDQAQTVALSTVDDSGLFTVPTSVSFAAGESETSFKISFVGPQLDPRDYKLIVSVAEPDAFQYGMNQYEFTIGLADEYRWVKVGTGTYTYSIFLHGVDSGLELYQHAEDTKMFKIAEWGFGVNFVFSRGANGVCLVDDQPIGYVHPDYGDVYVDDIVDYTGSTDYGVSEYEDGVFYFNVIYYVSAGSFGNGYETFVLDDPQKAKPIVDTPDAVKSVAKADWRHLDTRQIKLDETIQKFRIN